MRKLIISLAAPAQPTRCFGQRQRGLGHTPGGGLAVVAPDRAHRVRGASAVRTGLKITVRPVCTRSEANPPMWCGCIPGINAPGYAALSQRTRRL